MGSCFGRRKVTLISEGGEVNKAHANHHSQLTSASNLKLLELSKICSYMLLLEYICSMLCTYAASAELTYFS